MKVGDGRLWDPCVQIWVKKSKVKCLPLDFGGQFEEMQQHKLNILQ
jgi:hypothetical protein